MVIAVKTCNSSNVETLASTPDGTFLQAILHAIGDLVRYRILLLLLDSPLTQKQLAAELDLNSGTLSKHMSKLVAAGVVVRKRSHGPYELQFREEVWGLLQGVVLLNRAIAEAAMAASQVEEEKVNRAGMRAAAATGQSESA